MAWTGQFIASGCIGQKRGARGLVRLMLVGIVSDIRVEEGLVQRLRCPFVRLKSLGVNQGDKIQVSKNTRKISPPYLQVALRLRQL